MAKQPRPTDAELQILAVLWDRGPSTVREIHEILHGDEGSGYTTVLKLLQIMTEKGLVKRDESRRTHVYQARYRQDQTQKQLLSDLVAKAFRGAAGRLVLQALEVGDIGPKELAEIRKLIAEKENAKSK
jgi:BlaI family transcriptional regulator, penicillinase repressor